MKTENAEEVLKTLGSIERLAREEVAKWGEQFNDKPLHALEWADGVFDQMALAHEAAVCCSSIKQRQEFEPAADVVPGFIAALADEILNEGRFIQHSTSQCSNMLNLARKAAKSRIYNVLTKGY